MQIIDLFSGVGGFSIAGHQLGWETILFCEKEPFPQQVLRERFPGVPIFDNVCKLKGETINGLIQSDRPIVLTGGFPCQPFSVAGAREGTEDDRHLWPEMFRIIKEVRPDYVIGENVPGLLSIEGGMVFEQVCLDLESEGYEVQAFVLPACATGAPHRRDRVWIVAYSGITRTRCMCGESDRQRWEYGTTGQKSLYQNREIGPSGNNPTGSNDGTTAHSNEVRRSSGLGSIPKENGEISEWNENAEFGNTNSGTTSDTTSNGHSGRYSETGGEKRESEQRGLLKSTGADSGINGNSQYNGSLAEQELRSNETSSDQRRQEKQNASKQSSGTDRPRNAESVHGSEVRGKRINPDTSIQGHQGGEQPGTYGEESGQGESHRSTTELYSGNYWHDWPSISPFHSGHDGLSPELVRHIRASLGEAGETPENIEAYIRKESNWLRKQAIMAAGNAIVPQVVLQIMKAIENHYNQTQP